MDTATFSGDEWGKERADGLAFRYTLVHLVSDLSPSVARSDAVYRWLTGAIARKESKHRLNYLL